MFHMMTALMIYAAIIDFCTKHSQSLKKWSDIANVVQRLEILKLSLSKGTAKICISTHTTRLILQESTRLVTVHQMKIIHPERAYSMLCPWIYFASSFHSTMDTISPKPPSEPPNGLITALTMVPISWICISYQSIIAFVHIMKQKPKTKYKRHRNLVGNVLFWNVFKTLEKNDMRYFLKAFWNVAETCREIKDMTLYLLHI